MNQAKHCQPIEATVDSPLELPEGMRLPTPQF